MREEWYEPSPRDTRRAEAHFATPEGQKDLERYKNRAHIVLERRIRKGFVLPPDELAEHLKWLEKHPMKE